MIFDLRIMKKGFNIFFLSLIEFDHRIDKINIIF